MQTVIENENLIDNINDQGAHLKDSLTYAFADHPNVGNIRGRGLFWSVELVSDKATKAPFPVAIKLAGKIQRAALDLGLMCYPSQGCADGTNGDHILLAPSYTSTTAEIDTIVDIIARAVNEALRQVAS